MHGSDLGGNNSDENRRVQEKKKEKRDKQDESNMSVGPPAKTALTTLAAELDRIGLFYPVKSGVSDRQMILGEFHCRSRAADEGECVNLLHFTAVKPK